MSSYHIQNDNREGVEDVDVLRDPRYVEMLRAYSDRLRRITGHPPLALWNAPESEAQHPDEEPPSDHGRRSHPVGR